jgi:hypothetical protein
MATRTTTLDLDMRRLTHIIVGHPTMFWAIPCHTTATRVGAVGDISIGKVH